MPLAVVAGLGHADGLVLDHLGAAEPRALAPTLSAATSAARALAEAELSLFAPAGLTASAPEARPVVDPVRETGWHLLVERCHYEFAPAADLGGDVPRSLELAALDGPDDPRLLAAYREVMRGTLDAHDQELVRRLGLEAATRRGLADLGGADPWECIRLACTEEAGPDHPVGLVCWHAMESGRGYLAFVGVAQWARGHGYGRQLVALASRGLLADGATTVIADTDRTNVPMVRAFADAGWTETETRLDFVLRPAGHTADHATDDESGGPASA